jgi:hypothetical protein
MSAPESNSDSRPSSPVAGGMRRRTVLGWSAAISLGALLTDPIRAAAAAPATPTTPPSTAITPAFPANSATVTAVDPFPQQADLNFETLFSYGETAYGISEIGEVGATAALVQAALAAGGDAALPAYQAYSTQFEALARRLATAADAALAAGHKVSARAKYLRAASYYNDVLFFVLGTDTPGREGEVYAAMQRCWAAAAALLDPVFTRVEIRADVRFPDPAGGTSPVTRSITMPAYLALAPGAGAKPTVIINNGSDAQLIDVYAYGAAAAIERGYNALIFEGPGQGSLLFQQNIVFTPYWQDVVTPLVDYLVKQPQVDASRIALTGWSFGGLLVFRAAAYEHRLAAVVGDPGYVDNLAPWQDLKGFVQEFTKGEFTNANWRTTYDHLTPHGATAVTQPHDVLPSQPDFKFLVGKRGEIYDPGYHTLSAAGQFNPDLVGLFAKIGAYSADAAMLAQVRSHVLIAQYEGDSFFGTSQGTTLHDQLTGAASRTTRLFTAAEGAQEHCAPLAPQVRNEAVFDWLDDTLDAHQSASIPPVSTSSSDGGLNLGEEIAIAAAGAAAVAAVAVAAVRHRTRPDVPVTSPL